MTAGRRAELCGAAGIFLAGAVLTLLIGGEKGAVLVALALIWAATLWGRRGKPPKKDESPKNIILMILTAALSFFATAPLFVAQTGAWRYGVVKSFVESRHTVGDIGWFPEELPGDVEDYRLQYLPTMGQGSGVFSVRFRSSADYAAQWDRYGKERAQAVYRRPVIAAPGQWRERTGGSLENAGDIGAYIVPDDEFWYEASARGDSDIVIYVLYDNGSPDRRHSDVIIVSLSLGMVQLSHT